MIDALIISDLHIGAENCQAKLLHDFLEQIKEGLIETNKLILNGDIFESFDSRLIKSHWKVLSSIRKLSDEVEVIWVKGNHDSGPAESVAHLLGAEFFADQYVLLSGGKKILITHGDKFDDFLTKHPIITAVSDWAYWALQKIDPSCYFAKLAKHSSKTYIRCSEIVEEEALELMEDEKCDFVCCGHIHKAIASANYFNSGCWTEVPCSYLSVKNGKIDLCSFSEASLETKS